MVALHVSNRHLELASVVAGIADANGLIACVYEGGDVAGDAEATLLVRTLPWWRGATRISARWCGRSSGG